MLPLLDRAPMLHSRNVEETRAFLAEKMIKMDIPGAGSASSIEVRLNGVYVANTWLGYVAYCTPVTVEFSESSSAWLGRVPGRHVDDSARSPKGEFWIHIALRGSFEARSADEAIECDGRSGVVISPTQSQTLLTGTDSTRLSLSLRAEAVERQLAALLGEPVTHRLSFRPLLPLDTGHGARLGGILHWAACELDRTPVRTSMLVGGAFEQFLINWMLLSQPSNYSAALEKITAPIRPRDVKRVVEYVHECLGQPTTLADLVSVSGVAGRTLLKHFQDYHGVSPMRYVCERRLERAREELSSGHAFNVATTARRWGFAHAGRFSIAYRRRFGESPSTTLAQARAACPFTATAVPASPNSQPH
jgi:AraC-like DNA-binding protein